MPTKVVVTGPALADEAMAILRQGGLDPIFMPPYTSPAEIADLVRREQIDAIIVRMGEVDASVINASDRLRVISKHGVGYNNIDVAAATRRGIPVAIARAANARSVAEFVLALMFALIKGVFRLDAGLRAGKWEKPGFSGVEVSGKCLGVVGLGSIGREVVALVEPLRMRVLAYDPLVAKEDVPANVHLVGRIEDMLGEVDVLSLNCPLNDKTRKIIGAKQLAAMKPSAFLINTARGDIVDEAALVEALHEGRIAGAGLDSFACEPPAADNPLWALPNVIVTPHIAGVTREAAAQVGVQAVQNVLSVLANRSIDRASIVNPEVLKQ